ncbi:MAG: hypothetical protein HC893_06405 [Chloroflexaceae bacterium]|nr:hypothetical protein [Chloroflexaceae bacterium]
MNTKYFQKALRALGNTKQAGNTLNVTDRTVANWLKGRMPSVIEVLLNQSELALAVLLDSMEHHPDTPVAKFISQSELYPMLRSFVSNLDQTSQTHAPATARELPSPKKEAA